MSGGRLRSPSGAFLRHSREAGQGAEVLVAELLGLLVTLIGETLTLSLVREAWPDASIEAKAPEVRP